jgi:mannose-6-phosphate isomerase-like protein (cupin superfamily)
MQRHRSGFVTGFLVGAALAAAALVGVPVAAGRAGAAAQGGGKSTAKVVLENARVRVRDVTFPPGVTGMHTHDLAHVGVVIQGGTLVFKYPDGKQETAKLEVGGVGFRDANVTHEPVNTGTTPVRVIEVELK